MPYTKVSRMAVSALFLLCLSSGTVLSCSEEGRKSSDIEMALLRSQRWVLQQRDSNYGWSTNLGLNVSDTARAVTSLQLADPGWFSDDSLETHLTGKQLELEALEMFLEYIQHEDNVPSHIYGRLAQNTFSLISICRDPRNFYGHDLVYPLIQRTVTGHPFVDAYISLAVCTSNTTLPQSQINRLVQLSDEAEFVDSLSLIVMALDCIVSKESESQVEHNQRSTVKEALDKALSNLFKHKQSDGSFGNIYSTALAMQALSCCSHQVMEQTMNNLLGQQNKDGSFGNLFATLEVLRGLSGRSYTEVQNTLCHSLGDMLATTAEEEVDESTLINYVTGTYTLWIQCDDNQCYDYILQQYTYTYKVPEGTVFFDIMEEAAKENFHFKFEYTQYSFGKLVHTINGLANQSDKNVYWLLYNLPEEPDISSTPGDDYLSQVGVDSLEPKQGDHILFWYKAT